MKKIAYMATAAIVCTGLLFTSCKKKETEDNDTTGAADHSFAETVSNDITNIGSQASYGSMSTYRGGAPDQIYTGCAIITRDTANSSDNDTLIVDFGTGCTGLDGRTRKGVLRYIYTAGMHYRDSGNVINVSTPNSDYYVDGNQIIINSKTIKNLGHDATTGYLTWSITSDIHVNRSNGNQLSWTANKTKFLISGENSLNHINWPSAKVGIYGTGNGTHTKANGNSTTFTVNVSQANYLVRDFTCSANRKHFVQGILEFTPSGKPTRYINFGSGNCDNLATVTINGHVYNITLP